MELNWQKVVLIVSVLVTLVAMLVALAWMRVVGDAVLAVCVTAIVTTPLGWLAGLFTPSKSRAAPGEVLAVEKDGAP